MKKEEKEDNGQFMRRSLTTFDEKSNAKSIYQRLIKEIPGGEDCRV